MISFQLTANELVLARKAAVPKIWRFNLLFGVAFFLLIGRGFQLDRSFGVAFLAVFASWYLFSRLVLWWQSRRYLQTELKLKYETIVSWSSDGFDIESSWARFGAKWSSLCGWRESDEVLMIYISSVYFFILPKRAFTDETQLADMKHQLDQHKIPRL